MQRRKFLSVLGTALTLPILGRAQQKSKGALFKIGVLWHASNADEERVYLDVLMKAFSELGYVDGKNATFLHRFPAERPEQFRVLARELVEDKADVIICVTELGAKAVREATKTIPGVVVLTSDPVRAGLVEHLARPGGNFTGLSLMNNDLSGKRLALFKEAVPNLSRIALLYDNGTANNVPSIVESAKTYGLDLRQIKITTPETLDVAFAEIAHDGFNGALVTAASMFVERFRIASLALAHKIPTQAIIGEFTRETGILLSYGQDFPEFFRKAAAYADKILKGSSPADLPVEQPTRFKLVVNLKTAKALGVTIPPTLIFTADQVIE